MISAHFIVDSEACGGLVGMLWPKVASFFGPVSGQETRWERRLEQLLESALKQNRHKLILVGNRRTILRGLQALMSLPPEARQRLQVGLWMVNYFDLLFWLWRPTQTANSVLHVFEAGQTFAVDLGQVILKAPNNPPQIYYFWQSCEVRPSSSWTCWLAPPPRRAEKTEETCGHLILEQTTYPMNQPLAFQLWLHECPPHSLGMAPQDLTNHRKLRFKRRWNLAHGGGLPFWPSECVELEWRSPGPTFTLWLDGQKLQAEQVQVSIVRRALPIIISMIPIKAEETAHELLRALSTERALVNRESWPSESSPQVNTEVLGHP